MILHLVLVAYKFTVASNFGISFRMDNFSRNVFFGKHLFFDFKRLQKQHHILLAVYDSMMYNNLVCRDFDFRFQGLCQN